MVGSSSTWTSASLRSVTLPTALWNPSVEPRLRIRYVDVSAVCRENSSIAHPTVLPASQAPSRARKIIEAGDVLFATIRPGLKRVAKVPPALHGEIASTAFCVLRPDLRQVDPDYLFFIASSDSFAASVAELETGASYPAVREADVLSRAIPLPPLAEQRKIAATLNIMRRAITAHEKVIEIAADTKRGAMRELFAHGLRGEEQKHTEIGPIPKSWGMVLFSAIRESLQYGTSTRCSTESAAYPVLRIPNIEAGTINPADLKYCNLSADEARKYILQNGDLLFIRTNGVVERLGSCAVYSGFPETALFASYLIRARLRKCADPEFVAYFYGSERGTALVAGRATPAADGRYNLNTGAIDALPLPLPPSLGEQRSIVAILKALDSKILLHQRKRALLTKLSKSLLSKLLTGDVCLDDLNLPSAAAGQYIRGNNNEHY